MVSHDSTLASIAKKDGGGVCPYQWDCQVNLECLLRNPCWQERWLLLWVPRSKYDYKLVEIMASPRSTQTGWFFTTQERLCNQFFLGSFCSKRPSPGSSAVDRCYEILFTLVKPRTEVTSCPVIKSVTLVTEQRPSVRSNSTGLGFVSVTDLVRGSHGIPLRAEARQIGVLIDTALRSRAV